MLTHGDARAVTTAFSFVYGVHNTGRDDVAKKKHQAVAESDLVSFRLEPEFRRLLAERAAAEGQPRANLFARVLVQRALTDTTDAELRHELSAVKADVRKVREDIATVAFVMLVKLAKEDPEKAKAWIREVLSR